MTTITAIPTEVRATRPHARTAPAHWAVFSTLSGRRFALSARTPREIVVPLLTPILFANVIAPALAKAISPANGIDYQSFVAVGTVGLLVPLSCILGGVGMIV